VAKSVEKKKDTGLVSAGVVPVKRSQGKWLFLILRVYAYWDFPKGLVEKGERPIESARRELREETGLEEARFAWGESFHETASYSRGKVARYFLAEVPAEAKVEIRPNPHSGILEHHEYRWVDVQEGRKLLGPRVREALEWAVARLAEG
jgi:8-oxo-dGTP pyrophosphatase MutT (NUDIX family)